MADITIDVNPQQRTINASPRIQQQVIPVEIEDSCVAYWGKILGDIDKQIDLKNALATKQDTLVSGTNIKTVNNTSLLGSGNITIDSLPSQSGNSGKFLKTDGTSALWETINIPTITDTYSATSSDGMSGKAVASAISSLQPSDTAVTHTALTKVGDTNKPVYIAADGTATACAYELNKSVPSDAVFTDTKYSQGTGINISGTTINHSNSVTAATAGTSSATSGSTLAVPYVTYDAQGHITASGTHTHTITGFLTSSDVDQTYSGTSNNAQSGIAVKSAIDTAISSTYKAAGSVAFANLPTLGSSYEGYVYNVTDSFTTTNDFVEGSGKTYPAGTNVVCIDVGSSTYKWDVLAGFVDLSGYQTLIDSSHKLSADLVDDTSTTHKFVSSSDITTWNGKQDQLVSGTTIKTINSTSLLGSGNISIIGLPSQTSQSGKFLTTDGTDASWATISGALPSQSGQSGKFLTTDGTDASWADIPASQRGNVGEIISSTIPLTDAGLHLLDGSLISGSGSYGAFVTYIAGLVSSYPGLFETEANWQSSVTTYGVCGKFVYDSVNNTVRLPKITGFTEGTIDPTVLGDLVEAGLPSHTHYIANKGETLYSGDDEPIYSTRALAYKGTFNNNWSYTTGTNNGVANLYATSDAINSSIYGNSSTVQPQAIKVLYYIVIANTTKTSIQVDIDQIATDLNGKVDLDASNLSNQGTSKIANLSMPSNTYDDLTLGASGTTYTAPANGWYYLNKVAGVNGTWVNLVNTNTNMVSGRVAYGAGDTFFETIAAKKGDIIRIDYNASGTTNYFRFIYSEGSKWEKQ